MRIRAKGVAQTGALLIFLGADPVEYAQSRDDDFFRCKSDDSCNGDFPIESQRPENRSINFPMLPARDYQNSEKDRGERDGYPPCDPKKLADACDINILRHESPSAARNKVADER